MGIQIRMAYSVVFLEGFGHWANLLHYFVVSDKKKRYSALTTNIGEYKIVVSVSYGQNLYFNINTTLNVDL